MIRATATVLVGLAVMTAPGDPADKTTVAFLVENVELVANQRRTAYAIATGSTAPVLN